jgi:hypothetical protein
MLIVCIILSLVFFTPFIYFGTLYPPPSYCADLAPALSKSIEYFVYCALVLTAYRSPYWETRVEFPTVFYGYIQQCLILIFNFSCRY